MRDLLRRSADAANFQSSFDGSVCLLSRFESPLSFGISNGIIVGGGIIVGLCSLDWSRANECAGSERWTQIELDAFDDVRIAADDISSTFRWYLVLRSCYH